MMSSNENFFRVTSLLWEESTGDRWIQLIKASDAEFDVFFGLRLNKRLSKHSKRRWFDTPFCPLWRHSNGSRLWHNKRHNVARSSCLSTVSLWGMNHFYTQFYSRTIKQQFYNMDDNSLYCLNREYSIWCKHFPISYPDISTFASQRWYPSGNCVRINRQRTVFFYSMAM